jgi:dethiobiotin synthetase
VSKGFFIIGTDTNVGKTLITASLAWMLSTRVNKLGIMKPFATGGKPYSKKYRAEDVAILCNSIGITEEEENVNPYYFPLPCSPFMATELLKLDEVDLLYALEKYEYLRRIYEFMLVEGIGGLLVPLNRKSTLLDFIKLVNLEVIIVTRSTIGTINHTLLTVRECKANGIHIRGIIVNKMSSQPNKIESNTPQFIEMLTKVPVIGIVPYFDYLTFNIETFRKVSSLIKI